MQLVLEYPDRLSILPNLQTDAEAYFGLGRDVFEHQTLGVLPPRHPPAWPAMLALTFAIGGISYVGAKLVLWLAFLFTIGASAWLAGRLYGQPAPWAAAVICACSPALHHYIGTVQYEVFTGALLLMTFVLAIRTAESLNSTRALPRAIATGVAGGALVVTREPFAVVMPLVALWIAHRLWPAGRRPAITAAALTLAIAATPSLTWSIVQSIRHGQFITISEKGPIVVELGHNPLANGTYNAPLVGIGQPTGLTYAIQNPGREIVLSLRKVLYFWGVLRDGWNVPRPSAVYFWRATTGLVPYEYYAAVARGGWLLVFFIASFAVLRRTGIVQWWVLPATVIAIMCVHIATLSSHRFAVSVLPVVFALIAGPAARVALGVLDLLRSRAVAISAAILAVVFVLMQFQSWPLRRHLMAADMDGLSADNRVDPLLRAAVRVADAQRGPRPVVLLSDEYFPRGTFRVRTRARRLSEDTRDGTVAMRVSVVDLDGRPACVHDVTPGELATDQFTTLTMTCELAHDSVATLAVFNTGTADFSVHDLSLEWVR